MRLYSRSHPFTCGVDLHARTMYLCVLDRDGKTVLHRNLPCRPEAFLAALAPYREDLVVGCECLFAWYWLADLCEQEGIPFVLGHALGMRSIYGLKTKSDKLDSWKIAQLLRGGNFPQAYVYPRRFSLHPRSPAPPALLRALPLRAAHPPQDVCGPSDETLNHDPRCTPTEKLR